jgi:hypothetical protein
MMNKDEFERCLTVLKSLLQPAVLGCAEGQRPVTIAATTAASLREPVRVESDEQSVTPLPGIVVFQRTDFFNFGSVSTIKVIGCRVWEVFFAGKTPTRATSGSPHR